MGYRSDVYMCITGPKEQLLAGIATLRMGTTPNMLAALDEWAVVAISDEGAAMTLGGQGTDWKWYDSYPDVMAHTKIFAHFRELGEGEGGGEDEGSSLHGVFVRIGEDDSDIESEHFNEGYELGGVQRSIYRAHDGTGIDLRPRLATGVK